jgi:transcriptional regulator with XRE-family HTH domain
LSNQVSFTTQRKAFANNLKAILEKLDYSIITFSLKLNSLLGERAATLVSTSEVTSWINNEKLPNLYLLTKISQLLNTPIDMLLSTTFKIESFNGRSFSKAVSATVSKKDTINTKKNTSSTKENKSMANTIAVSKTRLNTIRQTTKDRTDSKTANYLMVNAIATFGMLKTLSAKTGISTRSLRDYMYYGTAVPADRAAKIMKVLGTTARALGIYLDKDTNSYRHATIQVAK